MRNTSLLLFIVVLLQITGCKKDKPNNSNQNSNPNSLETTIGFGVLDKVKGIWNGGVTSSTALGGYPEWVVDFRPISESQVAAKNELDTLNDIFMSFFIAKYNNQYRVAFRNGGSFAGLTRVSYFLTDSVSESSSESYYRFSEIIKGKDRAYTDVLFKGDSMIMRSFTSKYNTLSEPVLHMTWRAKLQDTTSCANSVAAFNFPKKSLTKDWSNTFNGQQEAIYYSTTGGDPYPEQDQPYLGKAHISYSFANYTPDPTKKVLLIITTQPLINGFMPNMANLKYRSRYVVLQADNPNYTFNYMHPGAYYLYAFYDADGNMTLSSGDRISANNTTFNVGAKGEVTQSASINYLVP